MSFRIVKSSGRAKFSSRAAFLCALLFSGAIHLTLTPAMALLGALSWFAGAPLSTPAVSEPLRTIEIDIGWLQEPEQQTSSAEQPSAASVMVAEPPALPLDKKAPPVAAKKIPTKKKKTKKSRKDKPRLNKPSPTKPRSSHSKVAHPVAGSGLKSKLVDENATVNLLLSMQPIRSHSQGKRIGRLLVNLPQWRSFLGSAKIDPVEDFDRILLVGPEMSRSSDVVVIVQHHVPPEAIRSAIDEIVNRPPRGRWLRTKPAAALARADRAERLFVLSTPSVLVVAPPSLQRPLLKTPIEGFPAPPGGVAAVVHIKKPRQALARWRVALPASLAWIRLGLSPRNDGGALLQLSAEDATNALARRHAPQLSAAINAITNPELGALGALIGLKTIAFLDPLRLTAKGKELSGSIEISPHQLSRLLAYVEGWVSQRATTKNRRQSRPRRQINNRSLP